MMAPHVVTWSVKLVHDLCVTTDGRRQRPLSCGTCDREPPAYVYLTYGGVYGSTFQRRFQSAIPVTGGPPGLLLHVKLDQSTEHIYGWAIDEAERVGV